MLCWAVGCGRCCWWTSSLLSLLPLLPAQVLLQIATPRYRARSLPALARVNLQERPAATAYFAATSGADRARGSVLQ
jgi:hypothetical protein